MRLRLEGRWSRFGSKEKTLLSKVGEKSGRVKEVIVKGKSGKWYTIIQVEMNEPFA